MSGVEILASEQVVTGYNLSSLAIASMTFVFVICVGLGIYFAIRDKDFSAILFFGSVGVLCSLCLGAVVDGITKEPSGYETQYKVIISDETLMNEFYDKYEIIKQEGKIFTVREREE